MQTVHEDLNRARKHAALLLATDAWLLQRGIQPASEEGCSALALINQRQWKVLAILGQTGEPSATTLSMLAASYRKRADILARMQGAEEEMQTRCAAEIEAAAKAPSVMDLAARASGCGCPTPETRGHVHGCRRFPFLAAPSIGGAL